MPDLSRLHIKEEFLSDDECASLVLLIQRYAKKNAHPQPLVSTEKRTEIAAVSVYAHGRSKEAELLAVIRDRCQSEIEARFDLKNSLHPELMLLQANYRGDKIERHADNCRRDSANNWEPIETAHRVVSCVIFLDRAGVDFTGGDLTFTGLNKTISAEPGLLVAYTSDGDFEHFVPEIESGARYSILLWFTGDTSKAAGPLLPKVKRQRISQGRPRKLILRNQQSPGDVLMLTAAVRDLHLSHPGEFLTDVDTPFPQIWEFNPYIKQLKADAEVMQMHYPLIHECNDSPHHFIHGFRLYLEEQLGLRIKPTKFWADIHFSEEERSQPSLIQAQFTGRDTPFWLICTGGKRDYTAKWWIPEFAQKVVDHFRNRIQFVQFGAEGKNHAHPPLKGVINLVGHTDIRDLMRLVYHSAGVICPVTFAMHLAAAVPQKPGHPRHKACIVTAGGREPSHFTAYTNHVYLHANGQMACAPGGGCWKSRIEPLNDGDEKDLSLCVDTVLFEGRRVQRCMHDLVTASDVIRGIERYYEGGILRYKPEPTLEANWNERRSN